MSKKHKKNRSFQSAPASEAVTTPAEETLIGIDDLGGGDAEAPEAPEEPPTAEFCPENGELDTAAIREPEAAPEADVERDPEVGVEYGPEAAPAPTPAVLPELPPKEEPKPALSSTIAEPVVVKTKAAATVSAPTIQVKGSVKFTRPVGFIKRAGSTMRAVRTPVAQNATKKIDDLRGHSVIGIKVITMFNEYEEMRRTLDLSVAVNRNKCARKLYDIMTICCPHRNGANSQAMSELANIVFTRFCNGLGTLYTDKSLLAGDYNLPTPSEAIKFDAFYGAMYQLAECAKLGTRITFSMKSLETLLQSTGASLAIRDIKTRLDARTAQRAQEAKLKK